MAARREWNVENSKPPLDPFPSRRGPAARLPRSGRNRILSMTPKYPIATTIFVQTLLVSRLYATAPRVVWAIHGGFVA